MVVDAPFPAIGEDPYGDKITAWAGQVEDELNIRLSPGSLSSEITTTAQTASAAYLASEPGVVAAAEAAVDSALVGQKGVANGLAELDGTARLPEAQVPERLTEAQLASQIASQIASPGTEIGSALTAKQAENIAQPGPVRDELNAAIASNAVPYFGASFLTSASVLQNTMDACAALGGGTVRLGPGVFNCLNDRVFIPANVEIVGDGVSSTTLRVPDLSNPVNSIALENDGLANTPTVRTGIRDLTIDGNKAGQSQTGGGTALVRAWVGNQFRLDNLIIKNGRAMGVFLIGDEAIFTRPTNITNVEIHDCVGDGLVTSKRNRQIFLTNVYLHHNGGRGWYSDQSECHTVNVVAKWNGGIGIEFNNVQRHNHVNLHASFNGSHGIYFDQFITGTVIGLTSMNNGQLALNTSTGVVTTGLGYSDVYMDATGEQSYGITDRFVGSAWVVGGDLNRLTEVADPNKDPHRTTEDYGLYVEDGVGGSVLTDGVEYDNFPGQAYLTPGIVIRDVVILDYLVAGYRLPDVRGNLIVTGPTIDDWTPLTLYSDVSLTNNDYATAAGFEAPAVRREGRSVKLRGAMQSAGTTPSVQLFTLPAWARPTTVKRLLALAIPSALRLDIQASGEVRPHAGSAATFVSFEGIEFYV